MFETTNTA